MYAYTGPMNVRLSNALIGASLTRDDLARKVEVDPKSVQRWISQDRLPHARVRRRVAQLLGQEETYFWPRLIDSREAKASTMSEIVEVWPTRGGIPGDVWSSMFDQARTQIDVLVYAGTFLIDSHNFLEVARSKAATGVSIRLLVGEPSSFAVAQRGRDERKQSLPQRCTATLEYLAEISDVAGVEIRTHQTTLYASVYRADETMLVNPHTYGLWAAESPVFHLCRVPTGNLFGYYAAAYERVWETASPVVW